MKAVQGQQLAFGVIPSYRKYELFMARYVGMMEYIRPLAEAKKGEEKLELLDLGSGGGYLHYFGQGLPIAWTGVEFKPERRQACSELGYSMYATNLEIEPLPFGDNAFDVVVASHVFEHLENLDGALKEAWRVLKPGGLMIVGVPMHVGVAGLLMTAVYRIRGEKIGGHCRFFTMRSLKKLFQGKEIIDIRGFRLISARKRFGWEDHYFFYRANTIWGRLLPSLTPEVNVVVRKEIN